MRRNLGFGLLVLVPCFACAPEVERGPAETNAIEAAASAFLSYAHGFDYPAMRANATPDFEILIFGQRMGMDEFEALLRGMEQSREGRPLNDYNLENFNTKIVGDVAYTTWTSPNWLESAIFIRVDERWLMDRAASIRIADTASR